MKPVNLATVTIFLVLSLLIIPALATVDSVEILKVDGQVTSSSNLSPVRPPEHPVKLIFIHHSTGQNWLADDNGGLGLALRNNNYYVSDTNYDWGPEAIGSSTDIGNWWNWFRSPESPVYLAALFNESGQNSEYSRLAQDPGGKNKIIMFKSCFPNSNLRGEPNDPVPSISQNLLKGMGSGSEYHTVANAKGIYVDILEYFRTRQDTLFIVIAAPPVSSSEYSANARAFNNWLVNDWLTGYSGSNIFVFDFYNVLTTNAGNTGTNDLNLSAGNHHRWWNDSVQHPVNMAFNTSAYPNSDSDDHPTMAGNLKATGEYVPLLNYAYNQWMESQSTSPVANFTGTPLSGIAPLTVTFTDSSTNTPTSWSWSYGDGSSVNATAKNPVHTYSAAGNYTVALTATNSAGSNTLTRTNYISVTARPSSNMTTIGMYRGGVYYLRNTNDAGNADLAFAYGATGDIPVTGDWNGDGVTTIGMYRGGVYYLRNSNTAGNADLAFAFGTSGDTPVSGDWNGDGVTTIGMYRGGTYYLRNTNDAGNADLAFAFGSPGDIPVTGDWTGKGYTSVGMYRGGVYYLRNTNSAGNADLAFAFGSTGDIPVTGDWNGDSVTTIGMYRGGTYYLRNTNDAGNADLAFAYGSSGDIPVTGKWI